MPAASETPARRVWSRLGTLATHVVGAVLVVVATYSGSGLWHPGGANLAGLGDSGPPVATGTAWLAPPLLGACALVQIGVLVAVHRRGAPAEALPGRICRWVVVGASWCLELACLPLAVNDVASNTFDYGAFNLVGYAEVCYLLALCAVLLFGLFRWLRTRIHHARNGGLTIP